MNCVAGNVKNVRLSFTVAGLDNAGSDKKATVMTKHHANLNGKTATRQSSKAANSQRGREITKHLYLLLQVPLTHWVCIQQRRARLEGSTTQRTDSAVTEKKWWANHTLYTKSTPQLYRQLYPKGDTSSELIPLHVRVSFFLNDSLSYFN